MPRVCRSTAWRRLRIDGIIDRCVRYELGTRACDYIAAKFGAVLLIELSDAQLQHVHQLVAKWAMASQTPFKTPIRDRTILQIK